MAESQRKRPSAVTSCPPVSMCLNRGGQMRIDAESETLIAHSLRADGFDASEDGTGRGTPIVPIAFPANMGSQTGGVGVDICPTMLVQKQGGGGMPAVAFNWTSGLEIAMGEECSPTLKVGSGLDIASPPAVAFQEAQTGCREYDTAGTLRSDGPGHDPVGTRVRSGLAVRRLTPLECERLQGFPDGWTAITYRGKPAADGPRYKALGNSMAVPVMRWILTRIIAVDRMMKDRA